MAIAVAALGAILAPAGYASAGWIVGSMVGNLIFPQGADQRIEGPRFTDLSVQTAQQGTFLPILRGTQRSAGNVIWATPIREIKHTSTQSAGGKGGGPTTTTTTYQYLVNLAILCSDVPTGAGVRSLLKVYVNKELKYDAGAGASASSQAASALLAGEVWFYGGSPTQEKNPLIVSVKGDANTQAYLDECYLVLRDFDCTAYGGKIPQFEAVTCEAASLAAPAVTSYPAFATVASLGVGSNGKGMGPNGDVFLGGSAGVYRVNFYSNAILSAHSGGGTLCVGRTLAGEPISVNAGQTTVYVLAADGNLKRYSGAIASLGTSGNGVIAESGSAYWATGDSVSGANTYRFTTNIPGGDESNVGSYEATQIIGHKGGPWLINGNRIAGRIYGQESDAFGNPPYIGYFDVDSLAWVRLWNPGFVVIGGNFYHGALLAADGTIWLPAASGSTNTIEVRSGEDGSLIATITTPTSTIWGVHEDRSGLIWVTASGSPAYVYHPTTRALLTTSAAVAGASMYGFTEDNRAVFLGNDATNWYFKEVERVGRVTPGTVQLSSIASMICQLCGLAPAEFDVSLLTDPIDGYAIGSLGSGRAALERPLIASAVDAVERSGKIVFVPRATNTTVTEILADDLAARRLDDETGPPPLAAQRAVESGLPRELTMQFFDASSAWQINVARALRRTTTSKQTSSLEMPLSLTPARAAQIAHMAMDVAWIEAFSVRFTTTRKYTHLEPTDRVRIWRAGLPIDLRITRKEESGAVIEWEGVRDDPALYTQSAPGSSFPSVQTEVSGVGITELRLLDIPLLRDEDNGPGIYGAASGLNSSWSNAALYKSIDGGTSYAQTSHVFSTAATLGSATTVLPNFTGGNTIDAISTVDVRVRPGQTLQSITDDQLLAGGNPAVLGVELLHFGSAVLISADTWRLSRLLRWRRGTDAYMSAHAIGDPFVLLSTDTIRRIGLTAAEVGVQRIWKAPASGATLDSTAPYPFVDTGVSLKPLSPVHLRAGRTANASWDVTIAWDRRTRISPQWRYAFDPPLGEDDERYQVEIWDSTFTTLKRTLPSSTTYYTTPQATYSSADQVTDWGSNQTTIYARVKQFSTVVGAGFSGQAAMTV